MSTQAQQSGNNLAPCVISASFTIEPLQQSIDFLLEKLTLPVKTQLTPYHQIFQQLLDPTSETGKNQTGSNLFLLRLDDFVRDIQSEQDKIDKVTEFTEELISAFNTFSAHTTVSSLVLLLPASPFIESKLAQVITDLNQKLSMQLSVIKDFVVLSPNEIEADGFDNVSYFDNISDDLGHVPYNKLGYAKLALIAARKLHTFHKTAKKVLVLDCDNTIWKGIVGEDGIDGITLTPSFLELQQFAVDIQKQGVLICLASKNSEQDVLDVFEQRQDMLLSLDHIISYRINWEPKAANLQSLADELNLGIDSFVFLDDNPVECGQMMELQPAVTTVHLSDEAAISSILKQLWLFDRLEITEEDERRTQMYRENTARQEVESSITDMTDFLASLNLKVNCGFPSDKEWPRVAQLTQRTNQFNLTTIRRTEAEVRALSQQDNGYVLKVDVSDRFGHYGLVGNLFATVQDDTFVIDTFLLSCRVLGRGVEYEMLRCLARLAKENGCNQVKLPYISTVKNEPARAFADSIVGEYKMGDDAKGHYLVPSKILENIVYIPGNEPEAVKQAKAGEKKKATINTVDEPISISEQYRFLFEIQSPSDLIKQLNKSRQKHRTLNTPVTAAKTEDETRMLSIWEEVLEINGLGMDDDYHELEGTSIMAARLFAEIGHQFDAVMRLTIIMDYTTPRQLLDYIHSTDQTEQSRVLITLKQGGKEALFLIHDGDGETLLYKNLAQYMPDDMAVYGIEPNAKPNIPLAYPSIDAMAEHYKIIIKKKQPEGPYILGGMCAGGLIAHVVAAKLAAEGNSINTVFMLDSATPGAERVFARVSKERLTNAKTLFTHTSNNKQSLIHNAFSITSKLSKKLFNALSWEAKNKSNQFYTKLRFKLLKKVLTSDSAWPESMAPMTVRQIYNALEHSHELPNSDVNTLLIRASSGVDGDIPFKQVYKDSAFGWHNYVNNLKIVDTVGGHSSMLQEPHAKALSQILLSSIREHR